MGCGCKKNTKNIDSSQQPATQVPSKPVAASESKDEAMKAQSNRKSCVICVEKHIGAAMVLATELQQGYPYRVRIIGHLHEAEEESMEWPELSAAIREERTKFQESGGKILPDFDRIVDLMGRYRAGEA